ncbi:MAG TPA: nitroreductase/quinone reductase family protein [Candidatus Dormibacteraeota bacterium]|jgi:deazaflavin-dependent oxidoreductase (nitroreductase family)|nr:nitroreductase/quinone reductase family protein [Candidatus Dormibacteraeota bacterium]
MSRWPKAALAVGGTLIGVALAFPASRKQIVRAGRTVLDEVALQADTPWTRDLVLLTTEGSQSHLPRTAVLSLIEIDGDRFVLPWDSRCGWLHNVRAHPDVVVDDRVKVQRARAEVVEGEVAERVRQEFVDRYLPGPLRGAVDRDGAPLGPGLPAVRLVAAAP